jgi:hypothetical protein
MKRSLLVAPILSALLLSSVSLSAQSLLTFGTSVGGGDDEIVGPLDLGFSFTMPDGTVVTTVDVDTNGRIAAGGTLVSDFSETVGEFLAGPSSICAYWDDLTDANGLDDQVFLSKPFPGLAVITWADTDEFGLAGLPFTVQVQLRANNSITIVWDARAAQQNGDCLVGITEGGLGASVSEVDFSVLADGSTLSGGATIYESFSSSDFDLSAGFAPSSGIVFTPNGSGYDVTGNVPIPARLTRGRRACPTIAPISKTLTPNGGGYILFDGGVVDTDYALGESIALADDGTATRTLSFAFPLPGGGSASAFEIDSNGRVFVESALEASDFTPSVGEFLGDSVAQICPLWVDLDPTSGGTVWFHDDGTGTSASVTWEGIPEFSEDIPNTLQLVLYPTGVIEFHYLDLTIQTDSPTLIGVSPGNGAADPGEIDFSAAGFPFGAVGYEFFGSTEDTDFDDKPNDSITILATRPVLGQTFVADIDDDRGTAIAAAYFFGFPTGVITPSIPLGILDVGLSSCELLSDLAAPGAVFFAPIGTPGIPTPILTIPNDPFLLGVTGLTISALVIDPTLSPSIFPSDELITTLGV